MIHIANGMGGHIAIAVPPLDCLLKPESVDTIIPQCCLNFIRFILTQVPRDSYILQLNTELLF